MVFAGAATAIRALGIPLEAGMTVAGVIGALALVDALFLHPPTRLKGT